MASLSSNPMIGVIQMTSTSNKEENFDSCKNLVKKASDRGAKIVFLPEGCDFIAESKKQSIEMSEPLSGHSVQQYCQLAASLGIWLSVGGMHIREKNESKLNNTHLVIDSCGKIVSKYCKSHLFNVEIPERNVFLYESSYVNPGMSIGAPVSTPCGNLALGICYDLRFPELSLIQRKLGAQILTYPSAFTIPTGLAHWHTLLKARAIETQCYVVAAAQTGQHNSKRSSFGHALIVDPWGSIVAEVEEGCDVAVAEIDLHHLDKIRKEMPVFTQRRVDLYHLNAIGPVTEKRLTELQPLPKSWISYKFGEVVVPGDCIFLKTSLSHAFANKRPIVPGHVLVTPEEPKERLADLTEAEVSDLAQAVVLTVKVIANQYEENDRVQVAIQDGPHSGQTIKHLHVHVVPTPSGGIDAHDRKWRNESEMREEAFSLRIATNKLHSDPWINSSRQNCLPTSDLKEGSDEKETEEGLIPSEKLYFQTRHSFGFLSTKPVLPGHACLSPVRTVHSFSDLCPEEVVDLFLCIQKSQKKLEEYFGTNSTTVCSICSLHSSKSQRLTVHVIPRMPNDLEQLDDIYNLLLGRHQLDSTILDQKTDESLLNFLQKEKF